MNKLPLPGKHNFPVDTEDLKIYYQEGGVLYFIVVFQQSNKGIFRIYYTYLYPIQIKQRYKADQESITFTFFEFTKEAKSRIYTYCISAIQKCKTQSAIAQTPIETATKDEIDVESYSTISIYGSADDGVFFEVMINKNPDSSAKVTIKTNTRNIFTINTVQDWISSVKTELGILIPIENPIIGNVNISQIKEINNLFSNPSGKAYYTKQTIKRDGDNIELMFSKCLSMTSNTNSFTFHLNDSGTLQERIDAISFLYELSIGEILLNDNLFKLQQPIETHFFADLSEIYDAASSIDRLLEEIPVLAALRNRVLPSATIQKLEQLAFEYFNVVGTDTDPGFELYHREFDSVSIVLLKHTYLENSKKKQKIFNPFNLDIDNQVACRLIINKSEMVEDRISFFCVVETDFWELASNINPDVVKELIKRLNSSNSIIREKINNLVLNLLAVYDKSKQNELLNLAYDIITYLDQLRDGAEEYIHINLLQTKYRKFDGEFDSEDADWLVLKIQKPYKNSLLACASLILLRQKKIAKEILSALPDDEKEAIELYPLGNLLKD